MTPTHLARHEPGQAVVTFDGASDAYNTALLASARISLVCDKLPSGWEGMVHQTPAAALVSDWQSQCVLYFCIAYSELLLGRSAAKIGVSFFPSSV